MKKNYSYIINLTVVLIVLMLSNTKILSLESEHLESYLDSSFYYSPAITEVYKYNISVEENNSEKSVATDYKTEKTFNIRNYFYTKVVKEITNNGDIVFEVNFDSINGNDGSSGFVRKFSYNKDHCYNKNPALIDTSDYIIYFVLISEPFNVRVSKHGEVLEAYGLQRLHKNLYSVFKDTLSEPEKESVRESLNTEVLCEIFQNEYIQLPEKGIKSVKDSWVRKTKGEVLYWEIENNAKHSIKEISDDNVKIESELKVVFLKPEAVVDNDIKFEIEDYKISGTGITELYAKRTCVSRRESFIEFNIKMKLSTKDELEYSNQNLTKKIIVKLMNEDGL